MTAPATKARSETATGAKIDGTKEPGAGLEAGVGAGACCAMTALLIAATTTTATRAARLTAVKVEAIALLMMKEVHKQTRKGEPVCSALLSCKAVCSADVALQGELALLDRLVTVARRRRRRRKIEKLGASGGVAKMHEGEDSCSERQ